MTDLPDLPPYTPENWYWVVGSDESRVFSSVAGDYVPLSDAAYVAWRQAHPLHIAPKISSEAEMGTLLADVRVRPANAAVLDAFRDAHAGKVVIEVPAKLLLWMVNEIRKLKGQPALGAAAFRTFVKGQM